MIANNKPQLSDKLDDQRHRTEIAQLKLDEVNCKSKLRLARRTEKSLRNLQMKYDASDSRYRTSRRTPRREITKEDGIQSANEHLTGIAIGRDLRRNNATYKTIERQLLACTVGVGPKVKFNTGNDEWDQIAASWFNSDWSKWCDGVDDSPLGDMIAIAFSYMTREGDVLCVFDDFDRDDGTLRWFEPDQLATVKKQDWDIAAAQRGFQWKENDPKDGRRKVPMLQDRGVIRDRRGRVVGYIFTNKTGNVASDIDQVTIVPRWDVRNSPNGSAKLIKSPWRFNQYRGVGDSLTIANEQRDIYEMRNAELASAKKAAQYFATIETDEDGESGIIRALQKGNLTQEEIDAILHGEDGTSSGITGIQYESLEGLLGGKMEYLDPGDKMNMHSPDRPSSDVSDFSERVQVSSGAAMGLGRSRSLMKAESSYTAFRGEELMTWQTAVIEQKRMERRLMDYLVFKAVGFAQRKRFIPQSDNSQWWTTAAFSWPAMREVDEVKTANAERIFLKNGSKNLADILGPDWRTKVDNLESLINVLREKNLPLSIFETVSGSVITDEQEND